MENTKNTEGKGKAGSGRKIVTALIMLIILIGLVVAARFLVGSVDIMQLLKSLHGG